ncbi:MAG: HxlR family transcriptional regulator [Calditrichaeota bacterium]|nr:MAG: HxlR family transcriptional regulator [Calditrichota bacterium]
MLYVIGGKWKILILWNLKERTLRFSELKKLMPGITQKMLTSQLRELESDKIVHREVYAQIPPKVEYSLTQYARGLIPLLGKMCKWGKNHQDFVKQTSDQSVTLVE